MTTTTRRPRTRGRPRSADADASILAAVPAILATDGFAGLTIEAIAAQAGVARSTVYRRWSSKEALVVAAVRAAVPAGDTPVDTGSLRGDLLALLDRVIAVLTRDPLRRVVPAMIGELGRNEALAQLFRGSFVADRQGLLAAALRRGVARGEAAPDVDPALAAEMLVGPVFARALITGRPLEGFAEPLVDALLRAVAPRT